MITYQVVAQIMGLPLTGNYMGDEPDEPVADGKRIRRGRRRRQKPTRRRILQALVDLGGRNELHLVPERVHEMMKGRLNEHDLVLLTSDGVTPRWRNTAQWARNALREEGLIRDDTPRSVWEISEKGRVRLADRKRAGKK